MGKGKKVFMVLFMLVVFFSLIVWLIKKFSELKEEADKRRAKENEERHAESAIFEEQEEKHTREEEIQERKMISNYITNMSTFYHNTHGTNIV